MTIEPITDEHKNVISLPIKIGIIGSGVVGLAVGVELVRYNKITFYDINNARVQDIRAMGYSATMDIEDITRYCDVFIICVPTPTTEKKLDLGIMQSVLKRMAKLAKTRKEYFLIVMKSTVLPTTTEETIIPLIEKHSGKKVGQDFGVCVNPEFVREKEALSGENPDRIVIGQYDTRSGDLLQKVYSNIPSPLVRTDIRTAEMIKYANNCFYAAKISFFNEIHMVCKKLGVDSRTVRRGVQMDKYYATHPWEHGHAFGGKCLPKDLQAFISFCSESNVSYTPVLLKSVQEVNESMEKQG